MSFDEIIDRRGTHCVKWDKMEALYGVSPDEGIAMGGGYGVSPPGLRARRATGDA